MIKIKADVTFNGLKPEILLGIIIAEGVFISFGLPLVITSICDGLHNRASLHYVGMAFDIRIKEISAPVLNNILNSLKVNLSTNYDVVLEANHIHIEYQPK